MKPAYAILRTAKLKSLGNVGASLSHTYRTRETPNADTLRQGDNTHSHSSPAEVLQSLQERLPDKRRKDAVIGIEYFVGASPEWFGGRDRAYVDGYFEQALDWLRKRHGADNVVGWSIHRDETSPHLVAYVVPLDGDGLNARKWLGGRAALSKMQTDFFGAVGRHNELARGIEGSRATHTRVKEHYGAVSAEGDIGRIRMAPDQLTPRVVAKGFFGDKRETQEQVAERITDGFAQAYASAVALAKTAQIDRKRADEMAETARSLAAERDTAKARLAEMSKHLAPVLELATLAKQEFVDLVRHAHDRCKAIREAQEQSKDAEAIKGARDALQAQQRPQAAPDRPRQAERGDDLSL